MVLSVQQAIQSIKSPKSKDQIQEAKAHEDRIKFHSKPVDKKERAGSYFDKFMKWVEEDIALPADKMKAFRGMCVFPLPTTALCASIFEEYKKVFITEDSYRDYDLLDDTMKSEFHTYLDQEIKVRQYFERNGLDDLKKQHNCVYVVDMPSQQEGLRPNPYFYKVGVQEIIDISVRKRLDNADEITYIIFKKDDRYVALDNFKYMVFERDDEEGKDDYKLLYTSFHGLGYTPATFLSVKTLYDLEDGNLIARRNSLSDHAGDLDFLLFYKIAHRMYETYGPFPILTIPETDCDFTDAAGNSCNNGILSVDTERGVINKPCPACSENSIVGPGTIFSRPVPKYKDDPILPKAVDITSPDVKSLDYITKKINALEWEIFENTVGNNDEMVTKESVNVKQVQSSVEGKRNVLLNIKANFEHAEKFIVDTVGRLMYGEYYQGCSINYGEQFLLYTARDIVQQFAEYKRTGLPTYLVSQKKELLVQTQFKNNPYEKRRAELLDTLEPWPDLSISECQKLSINTIFPENFILKIDFANFISKFELANGDIVQWGSLLTMEQKVNKITKILLNYVREQIKTASIEPGAAFNASQYPIAGSGKDGDAIPGSGEGTGGEQQS